MVQSDSTQIPKEVKIFPIAQRNIIYLQAVLGVEVPTGGSTQSNVRFFEAFVTIYLSITRNI
jgi:hypothetical protein